MAQSTPTNGRGLLKPKDAAALLGVAEATLENWRRRGHGPPHLRMTKRSIRYRERDVRTWLDSRLRASTAAERPPAAVAR